jgi:EAL domain-containing protein (putative c-di-GMP-specific phosphodiesterase class I)
MLVVDDDVEFTKLLTRVAVGAGWTVDQTHGPDGFMEKFSSMPPHAVVVDLHLGAADGIELLRWLSTKGYQSPVLIMSGFDDRVLSATQNLGNSLGLNIAGVIRKPARANELRKTFENLRANTEPLTGERIDQAVARGEMQIHVQPVVEAGTQKLVKVEALARWKHPARGMLPPTVFIPVLERDPAAMDRFTLWAIREVMGRIDSLGTASPPLIASVNVSAVNLNDLSLPDRIAEAVHEAGQTPARLTLEITESAATSDPTATMDILTRLRLKGFGLSLDDFGTGFSSLVALHRLPFTSIKIDKSFIGGLPASREAAMIVKTVADLAHNIGLRCIAEGVESLAVGEQLRELGVGLLQGYAYGRPVAMDEFAGAFGAAARR